MKKKLFNLILCFFITQSIFAQAEWQEAFANTFDDENNSDIFLKNIIEDIQTPITRQKITPNEAAVNLTDPTGLIQAQKILQNPLYYYSFYPIRRNVIDEPIFQQFTDRAKNKTSCTCNFFFLQTYKEYFYGTQESINSYIDMIQQPINDQVDLLTQINDFDFLPKGFKVTDFLGLFKSLFLEQRETGFMFEFEKNTLHWTVSFRLPFFYLEHNLNMPEIDKKKIQSNSFFTSTDNNETQFARQHLVSDRLGIGDTRINFEYVFVNNHMDLFSFGIRFTIPTAFSMAKGLYGNHFSYKTPDPQFDLYNDLLLPGLSTEPDQNIPLVQQNVINFGYSVIDRLSTILIEAPLGNRGHFGLGFFSHNKMIFSKKWSLTGLTSIEVLLPGKEDRFFILESSEAYYNAFDWNDTSEETGKLKEKLAFLNTQFIDKFFPTRYQTVVFPGFLFQSTSSLTYAGRRATISGGTDLWWKSKESFLSIKKSKQKSISSINIKKAKSRFAYQSKLWGCIEKEFKSHALWIGLQGQIGLNSFGIGDDWGFSLLIKKDF